MQADPTRVELLLVDDDDEFRETVASRFRTRGFPVTEARSGEEALEAARRREFDVAVVDVMMPGMSGVDVLKELKGGPSDCEVIMLTGQGSIETAVEAMKAGAYDFLTKPFPLKDLESLVGRAYERRALRKENQQLRTILQRSQMSHEMIGRSPAMLELFRLVERAGPSDKAILIEGESGTGKELVARALHATSNRADKPLVVINCWKASFSVTRRDRLRERSRPSRGSSKWPTAGHSSSTRSANCRVPCKPSSYACSKTARFAVSVRSRNDASTCEFSRQRTETC